MKYLNTTDCSLFLAERSKFMTKYALIGLLAVCATVLCFSLIFRERLCELNIHRGNTVVQVTGATHPRTNGAGGARTPPLSGSVRYFRGRHPTCQKPPVPPGAGTQVKAFPVFQPFRNKNHIKQQ
ncbi:Hok/Gef family protein [Escherichia coli]|uniref:Hok/Gef family protein n=3 Tax=Escherichia coli TaxID=562 RepID=UPI003A5C8749